MENITFKDQEITLHDINHAEPLKLWASVALGRGLATVYRNGKWCIVHLISGQILTYSAFDSQKQAEFYITEIVNVLDWRNNFKAILAFLDRDSIKHALVAATRAAWQVAA